MLEINVFRVFHQSLLLRLLFVLSFSDKLSKYVCFDDLSKLIVSFLIVLYLFICVILKVPGVSVDNFSCFRAEAEDGNRTGPAIPPTTDEPSVHPWADVSQVSQSYASQPQHDDTCMFDPSECPSPEGITVNQERLVQYVGSMYDSVSELLPRDGQGKGDWESAFRLFHQYLLFVEYKQRLCLLFETTSVSPVCNRYATKLAFSVHHAIVAARADAITEINENAGQCSESRKSPDLSDIAKAKIRYSAGACMSRITTRLRGKAFSDITNTMHSTSRKQAYDQHKLLAGLRASETHVTASTSEPASLSEIDYKQSSTRGLFHIPDDVFNLFPGASRYSENVPNTFEL